MDTVISTEEWTKLSQEMVQKQRDLIDAITVLGCEVAVDEELLGNMMQLLGAVTYWRVTMRCPPSSSAAENIRAAMEKFDIVRLRTGGAA